MKESAADGALRETCAAHRGRFLAALVDGETADQMRRRAEHP